MKRFIRTVLRQALRNLLFDRIPAAMTEIEKRGYTVNGQMGKKFVCDIIDCLVPKLESKP